MFKGSKALLTFQNSSKVGKLSLRYSRLRSGVRALTAFRQVEVEVKIILIF